MPDRRTKDDARAPVNTFGPGERPITAPIHSWFTSPARSHPNAAQAKELPLHLIQLILTYLDDVADLARITRTSRLFYYMTLPRLYEHVTLRSYAELRYRDDGRPEGYGGGSPFAMGLNTLVSRTFTDYVQSFRVVGEIKEHDVDDYKQGRVPDTSMILQIGLRAALDKMKILRAFAWELNTKPLNTVWQGLVNKAPTLTSLTLRCQTQRIPRPTTVISPLPNLKTLVVYDIDPLCYPDDISMLLLGAKNLENLKLHWNPRMRDSGEESVNLMSIFGRIMHAKTRLHIKRFAMYNLYTRFLGEDPEEIFAPEAQEEVTVFNSMGSSDPMTVFLDDAWRVNSQRRPVTQNLKMFRTDHVERDMVAGFAKFSGLERLYLVSKRAKGSPVTGTTSAVASPDTPSTTNGTSTPKKKDDEHRTLGSDFLAVIQHHHRSMRHLLLSPRWQISDTALFKLCQSLPHLEQLGFACIVPPLESLRQILALTPKLWALRVLVPPDSSFAQHVDSGDPEMHAFVMATEFWRDEYRNLKYIGMGERLVWRLGDVVWPKRGRVGAGGSWEGGDGVGMEEGNSMNARRKGPVRRMEVVSRESVGWIEIWGLDSTEFEVRFE